jgi:hypothetical protein
VIVNKFVLLGWVGVFAAAFFVACQSPEPPASEPASESPAPPAPAVKLSPSEQLDEIKLNLEAVKAELNEQGEYNCCVQPACHWCALHEGSCECFNNIQAGEAVCAGCGLGWHNGEGVVDGVDSSSVEWAITHEHPTGGHEH